MNAYNTFQSNRLEIAVLKTRKRKDHTRKRKTIKRSGKINNVEKATARALINYTDKDFGVSKKWMLIAIQTKAPHKDHLDNPSGRHFINDCNENHSFVYSGSGIGLQILNDLSLKL